MRLVILLVVALAVSTVQCVTACAQDDCGSKSAPCHQHDSSPQAKCAKEIPAAKAPSLVSAAVIPTVTGFVAPETVSFVPFDIQPPAALLRPPLISLRI